MPLGGHTVIFGQADNDIGNVSVVVDMGESSQSEKELLMRRLAMVKPVMTTQIQASLMNGLLFVEIWFRPWMVEQARNSLNTSI